MSQPKFMISGGGTGGHIFPAIAIANELKLTYPEAEFLFVGARDRMEMQRVPQAGYQIEGLWISGIQRKLTATNLAFPFKLFSSIAKCYKLLRRFKPDVVIGTGGFASGPLLFAANNRKLPTLIQEQNSYPGITNKLLASRVNKVCVAYDNMERFFPKSKIVFTGNPIRQNIKDGITSRELAHEKLGIDPSWKTLLILGGSLGARKINQLMESLWKEMLDKGINIIWQTGKLYFDDLNEKLGDKQGDNFKLQAFLQNMDDAYGAADIVISRAGAGTISELAMAGKATILIPSPNVAEDHQTKNALALVEKNAAMLFRENEDEQKLLGLLQDLLNEDIRRKAEENISGMAKPNAAKDIVTEVIKLKEGGR